MQTPFLFAGTVITSPREQHQKEAGTAFTARWKQFIRPPATFRKCLDGSIGNTSPTVHFNEHVVLLYSPSRRLQFMHYFMDT